MSSRFHVRFKKPIADGLPIKLQTGDAILSFIASHTPYDSLSELVVALITVAASKYVHALVRWSTEPIAYEFHFAGDSSAITLTVLRYPSHSRQRDRRQIVFAVSGQRSDIVLPFWRALRQIESQRITVEQWQHPFPSSELQKLGVHIEQLKCE
jgi:hypothetical protein